MRIAYTFAILFLLLASSCKNKTEPIPEEFETRLLENYSEDIKEEEFPVDD
jgi:hypothetical protein